MAGRYDIPDRNVYSCDTLSEMADNPDIDVIYIVTPNAFHDGQAIAAARAGKQVFCEKPMAVSVERCQQMIDACDAADRKLGVAYRRQYGASSTTGKARSPAPRVCRT